MLRLRLVRQVRGYTLFSVSQQTNIAQSRLSLIERALIEASPDEKERLAGCLRTSAASLFRPAFFPEHARTEAQANRDGINKRAVRNVIEDEG